MEVLKFMATWCQPCKAMEKSFSTITENIKIKNIDINLEQDLVVEYNVRSVPTLVFLKDGVEVERTVGLITPEKFLEIYKSHN